MQKGGEWWNVNKHCREELNFATYGIKTDLKIVLLHNTKYDVLHKDGFFFFKGVYSL